MTTCLPQSPAFSPDDSEARANRAASPMRGHRPRRSLSVGIASLGTPVGIGVFHLIFGEVIAITEVIVVLTITGTALFGSLALSERAFRLLRLIGNRPEPARPARNSTSKQ